MQYEMGYDLLLRHEGLPYCRCRNVLSIEVQMVLDWKCQIVTLRFPSAGSADHTSSELRLSLRVSFFVKTVGQ